MRFLLILIVAAAVIAMVVWSMQRIGASRHRELPAAAPVGTPAVLASGADRGPGLLHLSPTQLVFAAASGRMTVVERLDIIGATTTREAPDHHAAAPLLAISTDQDVLYFQVEDPEAWVRRLT